MTAEIASPTEIAVKAETNVPRIVVRVGLPGTIATGVLVVRPGPQAGDRASPVRGGPPRGRP